jgi:hypothetical protein
MSPGQYNFLPIIKHKSALSMKQKRTAHQSKLVGDYKIMQLHAPIEGGGVL